MRLRNIDNKSEKQLKAIEDKTGNQLKAIENQKKKPSVTKKSEVKKICIMILITIFTNAD